MQGEGDAPFEWLVSRACEEFSCLPSQAVRELLDDPQQLALDVMELRAYARTKDALDNAKRPEDEPSGPMVEVVWDVMNELLRRRREEGGRP